VKSFSSSIASTVSVPIEKKESEGIQREADLAQQVRAQEEERKRKIKATIMKLFKQMKTGCEKDICFNKLCFKNAFGKLDQLTNNMIS
jgi:hypothetical protein